MNRQVGERVVESPIERIDVPVAWFVPTPEVRGACEANHCGRYGRNHCCPPLVGSLELWRERLAGYEQARLFVMTAAHAADLPESAVLLTRATLNQSVLDAERELKSLGHVAALGFVAGCCQLCSDCSAVHGTGCRHADVARPSLEAVGVNVCELFRRLGRELTFARGQTTWVGAVLF